jgi:hypothetical protein
MAFSLFGETSADEAQPLCVIFIVNSVFENHGFALAHEKSPMGCDPPGLSQ